MPFLLTMSCNCLTAEFALPGSSSSLIFLSLAIDAFFVASLFAYAESLKVSA
uniref:Uncharacterized protein n=1 Tax=uncultured marine virus TaxID=186617 RepID=A0A0F7L8F3_9VIRU|nr:hypothetical protein [uncultured marine virus]